MNNQTTTPVTFQAGDRVVCADGVARTVQGMAPLTLGEPAHVVVEDGTQWIAANCRRANWEDIRAARQVSNLTAEHVRQAKDTTSPQWRAALADLTAAMDYLKAAETDQEVRSAIAAGAASAARDLAKVAADQPAEAAADPAELAALWEEVAARLTVTTAAPDAHAFDGVQLLNTSHPVAWTYRVSRGLGVRYGWVTARTGKRSMSMVLTRQEAEAAALEAARLTGAPVPIPDAVATMSVDALRSCLHNLKAMNAQTRGAAPEHLLHEDVAAALDVLELAHFALVPAGFSPSSALVTGREGVTGVVVEPQENGHVRAFWVEDGRYVTATGSPFVAQLREMRAAFTRAGWVVVRGGRRVVTAYRPQV
ncbi:hypothetical protein [Streptomyces fuscigenes]|uniref:hypothetical protein n=1 Tax=Streptomyces fuscigenes TaxID=1528880 RepID=UPI001F387A3F|nr:hypothetical protein [Streptomyces fuscigenes]MCF3960297.1 hypothetical protein [Streptomyces fuscigenes]